jgi:hypothetical protein
MNLLLLINLKTMKKTKTLNSIGRLFLERPEKKSAKQEVIPAFGIIQLILGRHCTSLGLLLFFSFLCMMPQITRAQQTKAQENREKISSVVAANSEEEEEEGSEEAAKEHERSVWYKAMQKKNANYLKVRKSYDNYFKRHPNEQSKPRQLYENWLKTNVFYLDKKNRVQAPPATNYNAVQKLAAVPWATVTDTMAGDWHILGPRNSNQAGSGDHKNTRGGYVNCVRIDPTNPNKLFVGFQTGGLWVSNDGGAVWQLTDKNMPDRAYLDIDVCKANSDMVYAISCVDGSNKNGAVVKSTDGGLTWAPTSLNSTNYPDVKAYDIAVSPTNSNIVLARWGTTLYRTIDGGITWTSVITGLKNYTPTDGSGSRSEVLDFHAANDSVVYHLDRNDSQNYVTLYRSSDGGATFTNLGNIGIPAGTTGNTITCSKLLSASNNPDALYIAMGTNVSGAAPNGIHLIKLNPTTGVVLLNRVDMINASLPSGDIAMDINNDNILVHGAYGVYKTNYSTNNGATFTVSTTSVHADLRTLCIVSGKVLLGNDGEAVYSTDGGITYVNLTTSISNHELWGFGASHKTGVLAAGLNHGPLMIREHEGSQGWYHAMGADQQNTDINPLDDKYIYSRGYETYHVVRTGPYAFTPGSNQQEIDPGRYGYNTMSFHPNLYYTLITHHGGEKPAGNPNLAVWKNSLIRSDNNGATISKIIKTFNSEIRREAICMTDANRIYVVEGTSNHILWKTTDGGTNWTEITPSTAVTGTGVRNISDVVVSDVNANEIWVTYSGVQNTCQVLHSTDGGVTYTNLTTSVLTTWPITKMIFQRGTNGGVYVGNKAGVFYRNNSMNEWALIGNGLPMMDVRFMFINYFKGKLLIGTSRGAWDHDLYELTAPKAQISASTNKIVNSGSVKFADYSVLHNDAQTSYSWSFPGGSPSTSTEENPVVNYSVPGNYNVTLTVTDQYGASTQTLTDFINIDYVASVATGSVTPIADTYVRDGSYAGINYGTATGLTVKKDGTSYAREIYLKFDLNALPSTADKVSLNLNVATAGTTVTGTNWQVYYVPTDSWTETGLTWNNKPAPSTLLNTVQGKSSGTVAWDITSQALAELGGDKVLSLKIVSTALGGTTDATLSSKEDANVSLRPQIITSTINTGPTVSITSPAANTIFTEGSNVTINANAAADNDGTISKVEFYQGSTLLGQSTTAPYSFAWNSVAAGTYALTAKATDNSNAVRNSSAVNIAVNAAPTVSITSPVTNTLFTAGSNITINATAADTDGTISKVEFYQGSTLLGQSTTAPYSFTWNNPATASYTLTAKATDNNGAITTSAAVNITINAAPTVSITSPVNNATFAAGSNVTINANATADNGTIAKVEFYIDSNWLGESTSAPYNFPWNNVFEGTYGLTAKATDNLGGVTTSTVTNITVTAPVPTAFVPVADAFVRDGSSANSLYGTQTVLEVKKDGTSYSRESYLRFDYSSFTGSTVSNTKLRVYVSIVGTAPSRIISVYGLTNTTWAESTINWNNKPTESGTLIGSYTINNASSVWYELDVTSYINNQLALGNKIVSFRLINEGTVGSTNNVSFNSREATSNKPQLVLTQGPPSMMMADSHRLTNINTKTSSIVEPISLKVTVSPNPSTNEFKVQVESSNEALQFKVYNISQQLVKQLKTSAGETLTFGSDLPAGVYFIEVKQGLKRQVVKVIKL